MHRIAIIGSGTMARVHANHWRNIPNTEIAVFASLDSASLASLTSLTGASGTADAVAAIERPDIDIVDICVPTPAHMDLAVRALDAGKHTFLEKPMARSLEDCDTIADAYAKSGVTLMVGHVLRFFPEFKAGRDKVESGALGTLAAVRTARLSSHPRGWREWYSDPAQSGGVILDMIIHDFDWLRWTIGDVDRVYAKGLYGGEYTGRLDYALVTLRFKNGVLGHVTGSWAHPGGFRTQFEVCGDAGMIEHDSALSVSLNVALRQSDTVAQGVAVPESPLAAGDDPYFLELTEFVNAIDSGIEPSVTIHDARAAVEIGLAAIRSIETGLPIAIG